MKSLQSIMKLSALLAMMLLASACSSNLWIMKPITPDVTLNGVKLDHSGLVLRNNMIYVPASFVTDVLGATLEKPTTSQIEAVSNQLEEDIYYSNKVGVIMYHAIMEEATQSNIISVEQFKAHMQWLKDEGFVPISIEQYDRFIHGEGEVPDNAVLITFDDGYENFYTYAYPILQQFYYPAVNFIIVSTIDNPALPGMKKLTWEQMREMKEHNIAFHNHTYDMHNMIVNTEGIEQPVLISKQYLQNEKRIENNDEYIARVTEDLNRAELRLQEELGNTLQAISFPYGAYNSQLLDIIDGLGIRTSFTIKNGINSEGDRVGNRINAGHSDKTTEEMLGKLKPQSIHNYDNAMLLNGDLIAFSQVIKARGNYPALYPLREMSNELDVYVSWDDTNKIVTIEQ